MAAKLSVTTNDFVGDDDADDDDASELIGADALIQILGTDTLLLQLNRPQTVHCICTIEM